MSIFEDGEIPEVITLNKPDNTGTSEGRITDIISEKVENDEVTTGFIEIILNSNFNPNSNSNRNSGMYKYWNHDKKTSENSTHNENYEKSPEINHGKKSKLSF